MNDKKVIWITGASSGIGKALSIKFAQEGWIVAASARREGLLQELTKIDQNIHSFPLDVTNPEQCKKIFEDIKNKFNNIEISIFGTGIHDPNSEKKFNLDKIREIMEVNYFGTMNSINSVYDYYNDKKSGQISIISSVAGYRGLPAAGAYCASKSALTSFTESLRFEMIRKNVRVSLVSPGFIKTPMTDQNDFPMPMIKSPEFAAEQIYIGLTKKTGFEIHFPKAFTFFLKFLRILPYGIYFKLIDMGYKR
ncbi:SDR family NAD(P)-dependent oxidoreductase [Candidatus Pelagibacter bacterium]|mgnify:FL=1|jgi:short-subunit dehydrogenase|nr:SDR family NAD(P)-dependent oxidoreductase [Candidatus Pelagibacter bacterium]MDC0364328.1 SDR family NAD(P)-dependent oxidoreductase [Candidatus Pelagibacter sp.]MDC0947413.1 SDR family NAD(P)-dependent oxidoreductase [Candidatus Pelagibacter sp.]MDC1082388.1 SDR family NAD(P)-dependent oxidoreductase [Candidatus Pelagibacter sp.]